MWKLYFKVWVCIISVPVLYAQPAVKIATGTVLRQNGNVNLVISNADLKVDGVIQQGNALSELTFRGNQNQEIVSSANLDLQKLTIDKTEGSEVVMGSGISVNSAVNLVSGMLNLNGNILELNAGATLQNESEVSYVTGDNGGYIQTTVNLVSPSGVNPGNLGAMITSTANLGNTIIRRGHNAQTSGIFTGIKRYYDILPSNNTDLDAVLRFHYLEAELNGVSEDGAELGRSLDNITWVNESEGIVYDPLQNYIQKSGIPAFSKWTIFGEGALPVDLISFDAVVNDAGAPLLSWVTVSESDFSRFELEAGNDGRHFRWIGTIEGKGGLSSVARYDFLDKSPFNETRYYRLKMIELDGSHHYSKMVSLIPEGQNSIRFFPNPVQNLLTLESAQSINTVEVFSTSGVLLKNYSSDSSINELSMQQLPGGMYLLKINKNKIIKVIKH